MRMCRSLLIVGALSLAAVMPAPAQPLPSPPAQEPPCLKQFVKLRSEAEKKAAAIKAASERHATAQEACRLFNAFSAAEAKMIKYAVDSGVWCDIPDQALAEMKKAHEHTETLRARICQVAAAPPRPAGPTLSESLSAPVPNAGNIKTGHGTFDTLTGAPLGVR